MAKYSGMSACEANAKAMGEVYAMQMHEVIRESILRHQRERTWEMPEGTYERAMFENWLDTPDTWKYGFQIEYYYARLLTREERIQKIIEYK